MVLCVGISTIHVSLKDNYVYKSTREVFCLALEPHPFLLTSLCPTIFGPVILPR